MNVTSSIGNKIFEAFSSRGSTGYSTSFKGFATRYSCKGTIYAVSINGNFYSPSGSVDATVSIYDGDFSNVLVSKNITVDSNTREVMVVFDHEIEVDGNFYIAVKAISDDGYFRTNQMTSEHTTADSTHNNKYIASSAPNEWRNTSGYDVDVIIYDKELNINISKPSNIIYIGSKAGCDFATVQSALNSIIDDSETNPYIFYIMPDTYEPFSMVYTDSDKTSKFGRVRWISLIGYDVNNTIFFDNKGNYMESPCEIWTNGVINITFINKTDDEHHTQAEGRTCAYAVHSDFGTCKTRYENCYMYSNAGPAIGIGTWHDEVLEFYNCRFVSDCDGTFGAVGQGAFFCHTQTASGQDATNQNLIMNSCMAIALKQANGGRLAVIAGYEGTYSYELQNCGFFGNNGASVSLQAPDNDLLNPYCFNNLPSILNTAN